jgi:hypothetical protein
VLQTGALRRPLLPWNASETSLDDATPVGNHLEPFAMTGIVRAPPSGWGRGALCCNESPGKQPRTPVPHRALDRFVAPALLRESIA